MVVWMNRWMNRWMSLSPRDRSSRSAIQWAIGQGGMGVAATVIATAITTTLAAPMAQAQNLTMPRCLQAADGDPYKVAQCSNPNARPPNLEEPAATPSEPAPRNRPANGSTGAAGAGRGAAQPATTQRPSQAARPGVPASSYNSANRVRATLDCLNTYGTSTNQVLSECGAWSPRLNSGTASTGTTPATTMPGSAPRSNTPSTMPPPPGTNDPNPGSQPTQPTNLWPR
jgi:hypothetical protein